MPLEKRVLSLEVVRWALAKSLEGLCMLDGQIKKTEDAFKTQKGAFASLPKYLCKLAAAFLVYTPLL